MDEYILREAAIASLCCDCSATGDCRPGERCVDYQRLKAIPAADVRPHVVAHWIGRNICSYCGARVQQSQKYFCCNCGAEMREVEHD